jgi:hypothetical protein
MEKNLYYVVEAEVTGNWANGFHSTGNIEVTAYEIIDNKPKFFCSIDLIKGDDVEQEIQDWLDDNGYGDDVFSLHRL